MEGAETLFGGLPEAELIEHTPAYIPDSEATTVAALREDFNRLLAVLREAGILASAPVEDKQTVDE